ncbi:MAG: Ldh family oxidoreductase [Chloroflexota bacterium]|nr:Ldh family oxidoreductase [Chloroflexota bacterium]
MERGEDEPMDRTVSIAALHAFLEDCLAALGCPAAHAIRIAEVLVDGELRGYDDHGAFFIGELAGWMRGGAMNPAPDVAVVRETPVSVLLDGDRGCGVIAATEAMRRIIAKAGQGGMACAGLRNSGHFIAAAPYVEMAARAGLIGFACANVTPLMAPPGGKTRTLGTNPLAYAFPAAGHDPLVFDMATSATAGFKVRLAALAGQEMAPGLILDAAGHPTTDPQQYVSGGLILPVGGEHAAHKGFGLAMVVDALAGVLTGAGFATGAGVTHGKEGQFFLALDPELFLPGDEFRRRMAEQIEQIKGAEPLPGIDEIMVPGERGQRRRRALLAAGTVPLGAVTWQTLERTGAELDVPPPPWQE